jgi:hypothetical protein
VRDVGAETDQLRVVLFDEEPHQLVLDPERRRLDRHQELHRPGMDHVVGELGVVGPHLERVVELLALESHSISA